MQRGDRWTSDVALGDLGIPEGIREVVGRRLSALSEVANDALGWAAVIGAEFDLAIVEAAGGPSGDELLDALDEATRAGVLREVGGAVGRYRFAHALVRSALHEEISTNRRVRMHWRVGEAIEDRSGAGADAPSTRSPTTTAKGRWRVTPRRRSMSPGGPRPRRRPSWPSRPRWVTSTAPSACWSCSTDLPSSCAATC